MPRTPRTALSLALVTLACAPKPADTDDASSTSTSSDPASTGTADAPTTSSDPGATSSPAGTTGTTTTTTTADTTTSATTGDVALACPPAIDAAIAACVADLQADPELAANNFLLDLLLLCSDAEPVADDYDAHCASAPADPICALEYPEFVAEVLPLCVARVQDQLFADVCLWPETYDALLFAPSIALMARRTVTAVADLDPAEQDQLLAAANDLGLAVDDPAAALAAADDGAVEQLTVLDVGTDRTLVLYTARYSGELRGRAYFRGTLVLVGAVEAGLFSRCAVERGVEGQPCETDAACAPDHVCNDVLVVDDVLVAPGACVGPDPLPGEGDPCSAHADCDPTRGLLCLDALHEGDPGTCRPGWMRRSFAGADTPLQPGGVASVELSVAGVATVPTAAHLDLELAQASMNQLALRLINPGGTSSTVAMTAATSLVLDLEQVLTPGDESAGGVWHLEVEDLGGQASGQLRGVALTLDTRWD